MSPTYQLETIPLWEAYREVLQTRDTLEDSSVEKSIHCPFCLLQRRAEQDYLNFYLGASVMNPENRVAVNREGFCPEHLFKLLKERKNHGYSLMLHTHLGELRKNHPLLLQAQSGKAGKSSKKQLLTSVEKLSRGIESCLVCDGITSRMDRYGATAAHLWQRDAEFRELFPTTPICLTHLPLLLERGADMLGKGDVQEYAATLQRLFAETIKQLDADIEHYTQMYKAENHGKPWGRAEGALERLVTFLGGDSEGEPNG